MEANGPIGELYRHVGGSDDELSQSDRSMKLRWQIAIVFAFALLVAFAIFGVWLLVGNPQPRHPRPFFGNYSMDGKWSYAEGLGLADGRYVYYDLSENVLMVVAVQPSHDVQWLVDAQPVG